MFEYLLCIFILTLLGMVYVYLVYTAKQPDLKFLKHEDRFIKFDRSKDSSDNFPSLFDKSSVYLSIIVPAYNEQDRLPLMLKECIEYVEKRKKEENNFNYEIIIVDDGSLDKTTEVASSYVKDYSSNTIRVLTLRKNRGKGQAIRLGTLCCRGKLVLFADADGATRFSDFGKLETKLISNLLSNDTSTESASILICGSRAHMQDEALAKRSFFRNVLMLAFHWAVWLVGGVHVVKDTQCGFKVMTRSAARILFTNLHVERWAFDVELLYLATKLKVKIFEVPVNWHEIPGSKIIPVFSWLQMGRDILLIRIRYELGIWKISRPSGANICETKKKLG